MAFLRRGCGARYCGFGVGKAGGERYEGGEFEGGGLLNEGLWMMVVEVAVAVAA